MLYIVCFILNRKPDTCVLLPSVPNERRATGCHYGKCCHVNNVCDFTTMRMARIVDDILRCKHAKVV